MKIPRIFLACLIAGGLITGSNPCKGEITDGCYQGLSTTTLSYGPFTVTSLGGPYFAQTYQITGGSTTLDYDNCSVTQILDLVGGTIVTNITELYGDGGNGGGNCCPVAPVIWGTLPFGNVPLTFANINAATFSVMLATNVHHITIFDLGTGAAVYNSGALGTSSMLTVSNSVFIPGRSYAVTACDSNNIIQGSACFQAGANTITVLRQFKGWQNGVTNMPGAEIDALVGPNQVAVLVQYSDASMALGTGSLNSSPPAASLVYQGLTNTPSGNAVMSLLGSSLYVSNLSSGGQDGLTISFPPDFVGMTLAWQPLVAGGSISVGGYITEQAIGTLNGVANSVLGTVTMTKTSTTNFSFTADFSPLGVSSNTVLAFRQGKLVGQGTAPNGTVIANGTDPSGGGSGGGDFWISPCTGGIISPPNEPCPYDYLISVPLDELPCGIAGATSYVTVDNLEFGDATQSTMQFTISALKITASQVPYFVITNENATLAYQGLANTSLGNAAISASGSSLYITNLSSGGQDGVAISIPTNLVSLEVEHQELDPNGTLPVGAYIQQNTIGTGGPVTNGLLGSLTVTKVGTANYSIAADFSPIGASTYTVQGYLQGAMVMNLTNQSGPVIGNTTNAGFSDDSEIENPGLPGYYPPVVADTIDWIGPLPNQSNPTTFIPTGTAQAFNIDHLFVIPEGVGFATLPYTIQLVASQIPAFAITSETYNLAGQSQTFQGLTNTALGNATIAVECCISNLSSGGQDGLVISNLSSSGQDGVSIAVPTHLMGLNIGWLPLNTGNAMPVGAWIKEQEIGTLNGVGNSVLGTVTMTKTGSTNFSFTADFSPLGVSSSIVFAYQNGQSVGQGGGPNGSQLASEIDPAGGGSGGGDIELSPCAAAGYYRPPIYPCPYTNFISYSIWDLPCGIAGVTGTFVSDHLEFSPATTLTAKFQVSSLNITASQVSSITIINENAAYPYGGLGSAEVGTATATASAGQLYVTNLGSSGQDGVAIAIPTNQSMVDFQLQQLDPSNSLPVGSYLQAAVVGTANGVTNGVLGTVTATKTTATNITMSVNFAPSGASTYSIQAYYQGTMVAQASNQIGAAVIIDPAPGNGCLFCAPWPYSWGWGYWGCWGEWGYWGCWDYPFFPYLNRYPIDLIWDWYPYPVYVSFNGNANVLTDHLYISADNVQLPVAATAVQLTASQVPAFSMSAASVTPLLLTSSQTSSNLTLRWFGTGALEASPNLSNWSVVSGATSPFSMPTGGSNQFFRVIQPSP